MFIFGCCLICNIKVVWKNFYIKIMYGICFICMILYFRGQMRFEIIVVKMKFKKKIFLYGRCLSYININIFIDIF